jgi:sterol desaturase/sphingolipid hydroxylase (fatty acid hydroxylase superfamily)
VRRRDDAPHFGWSGSIRPRKELHLTSIVIFGSLLAVALWECCLPRRQREFPPLRRRLGNLSIWILNIVLVAFVFAPPDTFRPQLEAALGVALPTWPSADRWLSFVAAFLLLDFLQYAMHRCQHAMPFLWRFHALHHSDPDVDVTTSVRHHPIEYLLAAGFYWLAVLALGIPMIVVLSHGLAVFAAAALTHGNISLPEWLERVLRPLVITIDLHLVHHSISYDEANANFGAVLSVWDRLFGTYAQISRGSRERLVFGVRELPPRDCLKPSAMLLTPWRIARTTAREVA